MDLESFALTNYEIPLIRLEVLPLLQSAIMSRRTICVSGWHALCTGGCTEITESCITESRLPHYGGKDA